MMMIMMIMMMMIKLEIIIIKQARKLQATLEGRPPKLCPLTHSLTDRGEV